MLKQRIITAVLLAPLLLAIVIYGNHDLFALLVLVIQSAATYEWLRINQLNAKLSIINGIVISVFTLFLADKLYVFDPVLFNDNLPLPQILLLCLYLIIWVMGITWLVKHRWGYQNTKSQLLIKSLLGVGALMLFGIAMYELYNSPSGRWWVLSLFLLIWVADIGAYISGKTMGKHKLAINISPGKTWEGVIGAQILVAVYAIIASHFLAVEWYQTILIMVPVALFSVVGDLAASLGKRQAKIKDSSNLLPGHGGFIDRFDSLIAATPMYYLMLTVT